MGRADLIELAAARLCRARGRADLTWTVTDRAAQMDERKRLRIEDVDTLVAAAYERVITRERHYSHGTGAVA